MKSSNIPTVEIRIGDSLELLKAMPGEAVDCVVTSPPYYGLRDYGVAGQMGLEATPGEFLANMTALFREVRRVLRKDGTCWVNMGDSYAGNHGSGSVSPGAKQATSRGSLNDLVRRPKECGMKPKDLMGMPWRLAFALQDDGWWLRQDIIWSKPNPMPESARDRCTKSHEYLFLLTKSARYYWDAEAMREPVSGTANARGAGVNPKAVGGWASGEADHSAIGYNQPKKYAGNGVGFGRGTAVGEKRARGRVKQNESFSAAVADLVTERNKRSVWTVPTYACKEAHFATYPPDLIKPCIRAGSPVGGVVLDPFGGSGTTGMVALELGRNAILLELNPEYAALAERRCRVTPGLGI